MKDNACKVSMLPIGSSRPDNVGENFRNLTYQMLFGVKCNGTEYPKHISVSAQCMDFLQNGAKMTLSEICKHGFVSGGEKSS